MSIPHIFSNKTLPWNKCIGLAAIYFIVVFTGILHHEIWMDEAHHFLMALSSNSISDLLYNARHEGHPLWNTVLFTLTRFTNDPFYMQALNAFLASVAVLIFLRNAPFSWLFKLLFISGYFMVFEYSIISRNYALSCIVFFTVLSIYPVRKQRRLAYAICIAFLNNGHLFAAPVAIVLLMQMLWEYFCDYSTGKKINYVPVVVALSGLALAIYTSTPPPADRFLYVRLAPPINVELPQIYSMPFRGMFYLPDLKNYHCWNTNFFTNHYWNICRLLFPLPALIGIILMWRKPFSTFFFLVSGTGMMVIGFFSIGYASRHCGFIYVDFIAALWISYYETEKIWNKKFSLAEGGALPFHELEPARIMGLDGETLEQYNSWLQRTATALIWGVLTLQVISGGIMYAKDFAQPFSESKEVSQYLVQQSLDQKFIVVSNQNIGPSVSAYLHRKLFHAENGWEGTYRYWNAKPNFVNDSALLVSVNAQLSNHDTIVLLLDHELDATNNATSKITSLKKFDRAILKFENYFVYLVERKKD